MYYHDRQTCISQLSRSLQSLNVACCEPSNVPKSARLSRRNGEEDATDARGSENMKKKTGTRPGTARAGKRPGEARRGVLAAGCPASCTAESQALSSSSSSGCAVGCVFTAAELLREAGRARGGERRAGVRRARGDQPRGQPVVQRAAQPKHGMCGLASTS